MRLLSLLRLLPLVLVATTVPMIALAQAPESSPESPPESSVDIPYDPDAEPGFDLDEQAFQMLSAREREVLERGPYSKAEVGQIAVMSTVVGFGMGYAAQDRWRQKGWIFTFGEIAMIGVALGIPAACRSDDDDSDAWLDGGDICGGVFTVLGAAGFVGFRLGEAIDANLYTYRWNRLAQSAEANLDRNREALRKQERERRESQDFMFHIGPNADGGATLTVGLRF